MEGIFKKFFKYVSFSVFTMMILSLGSLVDVYFISKATGSDGLTALNLGLPIFVLINGLGFFLGIGGSNLYSILKAQGKDTEANKSFSHSLVLGALFGAIFLLIGIFSSNQVASWLGAEEYILPMTGIYLRFIFIFAPVMILNNIFVCFIRNDGAPKMAMFAMVLLSVVNIVLDYVYIIVLDLGMLGLSLAVVTGYVLSFVSVFIYWLRKKTSIQFIDTKIEWEKFGSICRLGASSLISELSVGIIIVIFNLFILKLEGNLGVAAFGIITNLALISIALFTGIAQGLQPLVSQYYGGGDKRGLDKVLKYSIVTALIVSVVIFGVSYLFTDQLIAVLNHEQDLFLAELAAHGLRIYFVSLIFMSVNVVISAFLSAANAAKAATMISILRGGLVVLPIILVMTHFFDITGVWLSYPKAEFVTFIIAIFYLWKVRRVLSATFSTSKSTWKAKKLSRVN